MLQMKPKGDENVGPRIRFAGLAGTHLSSSTMPSQTTVKLRVSTRFPSERSNSQVSFVKFFLRTESMNFSDWHCDCK